jgi:putative intracellular protease/amidase
MKHHEKAAEFDVDQTVTETDPQQLNALAASRRLAEPGHVAPAAAQEFVREMERRRKPTAGICHALRLLTSTGCVRRRPDELSHDSV